MSRQSVKLTITRRFETSAERVFDAWLDPATARRWLFTTKGGGIVRAEIEPCVGGRFMLVDRRADGDIEHVGEYLVIERPTLLVFTFGVPKFSPEYDRVTIELRRLGSGCELTLTNEMSPDIFAEWGEKTREGWTTMLAALAGELGEGQLP
jgi:uncharacterized protein YndB with AHSA1/START domain